jgi:hypothetical protein
VEANAPGNQWDVSVMMECGERLVYGCSDILVSQGNHARVSVAVTYDAEDVIPLFPTECPTIATLLLIALRAADNEEASAER